MSLTNIRVILVSPKGDANVGAVARAMKNMGLRDLVLVRAAAPQAYWAKAMAVHADDVLRGVRQYESLGAAVADCGLVVGTTCRGGLYRAAAQPPRSVAPRMVETASSNHVALVFGPEDHGLDNDDLKVCQQLIQIPTDAAYASLNLAQAVMVCCYELFLAEQERDSQAVPAVPLATAARIDQMFRRLREAFLAIGYLHETNPEHILFAFRRFLGRAQLEERDVRILLGLAQQVEWYAKGGWQVMAQKRGNVETAQPTASQGADDNEVAV
jgi:tRNA/rRNA methyltransferase